MYKSTVIAHFGNIATLAKILGITSPSISQWGDVIPEKQALKLERLTDGALEYNSVLYAKQLNRAG